jgi:hypothetical protein
MDGQAFSKSDQSMPSSRRPLEVFPILSPSYPDPAERSMHLSRGCATSGGNLHPFEVIPDNRGLSVFEPLPDTS